MLTRRNMFAGAAAGFCLACGARRATAATTAKRRIVTVGGKRARTVDIHCHCVIPAVLDVVAGSKLEAKARGVNAVPGNSPTLEARLASMDAEGLDMEVMSINEWWYGADQDLARRIIDVQNEGLMKLCQQAPDRLFAFASVSLQFPELAAQQLEVAMKQQGLRGGAIGCSVEGEELSNPRFDPFWQKAEELQALLFLHPQDSDIVTGISKRVQGYGSLANVIGNPLETTIALSHLIMDGTLDKFPKLRLCAAHGGGFLPSYAARMDHGCASTFNNCKGPGPKKMPSEYLKQIYVDSLLFTSEGLRHVAAEIGTGQIMIGTDYGFKWVTDPVDHILNTPGLSNADKVAMLGGTATKMLKI